MTTRADHRRRGAAITAAVACLLEFRSYGPTIGNGLRPDHDVPRRALGHDAVRHRRVQGARHADRVKSRVRAGRQRHRQSLAQSESTGVSFVLSRTINGVLISKTFSKAGIDDLTTFPGKEIIFNHPTDATNAPGFYKLTVVHTQDVPVGTTETWNLAISGLPTTGLRTQGAIIQGIFKSLTPVAPALGTPAIAISPAPVAAGTTPTLKIASFGGFDLSQVTAGNVSISGTGVSNPQVSGATATGLNLAFSLARCAAGGNRTVSITRNALTASTPFTVTALPPPAISISPSAFTQGTTTNMTVSSNSCLDMSHATATISGDGITVTPLGGATVNALTLSVAVTATASVTARTLQVTADGGSATSPCRSRRPHLRRRRRRSARSAPAPEGSVPICA